MRFLPTNRIQSRVSIHMFMHMSIKCYINIDTHVHTYVPTYMSICRWCNHLRKKVHIVEHSWRRHVFVRNVLNVIRMRCAHACACVQHSKDKARAHTDICVHGHALTCTRAHAHARTCTRAHARAHMHARTCMRTHAHAHMHACTCTRKRAAVWLDAGEL